MRLFCILTFLLSPLMGHAALFSQSEAQLLAKAGKQSVVTSTNLHLESFRSAGIGLYYGDRSVYSALRPLKAGQSPMTNLQRMDYVRTHLRPEFSKGLAPGALESYLNAMVGDQDKEPRAGLIQMTNPLLWAYRHLEAAYASANRGARWQQIVSSVESQTNRGLALLKELQNDGWESIYWNPDLHDSKNTPHAIAAYNAQKYKVFSVAKYSSVKSVPKKGLLTIDHFLVNYRQGPRHEASMAPIDKLKDVPFWVGLANFGAHIFVGYHGMISESSSYQPPDTPLVIQRTSFASWSGGPSVRGELVSNKTKRTSYLSGVIMVPPGTWK